jgi:hypothetical protein|tara:strand:- start:461 stop:622 length:162 start_codon:yes stop_codon:yes gene_type:complete
MQDNRDVIEAGRKSWNKLSILMDKDPEVFRDYEAFKEFYELLVRKLFNEENSL